MNLMGHTDISWAKVRQHIGNVPDLKGATKQKSRSKPRKEGFRMKTAKTMLMGYLYSLH